MVTAEGRGYHGARFTDESNEGRDGSGSKYRQTQDTLSSLGRLPLRGCRSRVLQQGGGPSPFHDLRSTSLGDLCRIPSVRYHSRGGRRPTHAPFLSALP